MCVQCTMTAAASLSTASGVRVWLGSRVGLFLTPQRTETLVNEEEQLRGREQADRSEPDALEAENGAAAGSGG